MRALVLGGGGAKGAYEAGAIYHLLGEKEIHYDIIAGTSVGALNGTFLAQFGKGAEIMAAHELKKLWFGIDTPMIYRKWYYGLLWLLPALWKPSVFCTAPLRKLVREHLKREDIQKSKKMLRVGATSLTTGERRIWTEHSPDIAVGVLASSAFPGGFEPVIADGEVYLDDGIRETTPIEEAVKAGATHIDVISVDTATLDRGFELTSVVSGAPRVLQTMLHEIDIWDYKGAELYNNLIELADMMPKHLVPEHIRKKIEGKKRVDLHALRPAHELPGPLDFSPESIRKSFAQGYADAKLVGW